jgi:hypothetical protein
MSGSSCLARHDERTRDGPAGGRTINGEPDSGTEITNGRQSR